jgi:hypothetical protein
MPRSSSRAKRRRLRRIGRGLYGLAAVLVVIAAIVVIARHDGGKKPVTAVAARSATTVAPFDTAVPTSLAATTTVAPPANGVGNTPPLIVAPTTAAIGRRGASPIHGISLTDREAREGDTFALLLVAKDGLITLGDTNRLRLYTANGSRWLPLSGPLDAIQAALASLNFTPGSNATSFTLSIYAADGGHNGRFPPMKSHKNIGLVVH